MATLKAGDKAPTFRLLDQNENTVKLSDFKGKKVLVYFYPRANTPGCTKQSCSVSESLERFSKLSIQAIGISPDDPAAQKKFDEKYKLSFPLLSDADHKVADAYGAWGTKTSFGKKKQGIIRSAFLIDEKGRLVQAFYRVKPEETVPKALNAIEQNE